jgi:hypothetical protein
MLRIGPKTVSFALAGSLVGAGAKAPGREQKMRAVPTAAESENNSSRIALAIRLHTGEKKLQAVA